ncbi:NAD-dependent succinate-semialdehyde dehydrogenase [Rhizobium sp. SG2393]|uniref:NAD-dependent succinate-semialdehyde dehydrogenase n=1 Tax=Rhizobium sp. SG2393 TaxID=3276279 RepID=UPI00366D6036
MQLHPALLRHLTDPAAIFPEPRGSAATFAVVNPSTGEHLADVADLGAGDATAAVARAEEAREAWGRRPAKDRSAVMRAWHDLILAHIDDLSAVLTAEMGKPLAESRSELQHAAAYVEWYAEEAKRIYGETFPAPSDDRRMIVIKQPVGVVGTITPWNFPASMIARKVAPALSVGCAVVLKPAEQTPLIGLALHNLAMRAGIPAEIFSILTAADGAEIGLVFCTDPRVRKVSFTGSTEVGRILMRQGADQIKKLSLELGGNAPFIVFDDADIDAAVDGAIQAKFRNAGQTCVSANRLYVHAAVHDEFAEKFAAAVSKLTVGDGFDAKSTVGPLIDARALDKIETHIADACAKGATVRCGGQRLGTAGTFFPPTVLTGVTQDMQIARDETFGPVAPIVAFTDAKAVIREANDTIYGLAAYFYASDLSRVWRVAEALEYGMVGINTGRMSSEAAPFGGLKQSGIGREGSRHGAEDYLEMKYLCMGNI